MSNGVNWRDLALDLRKQLVECEGVKDELLESSEAVIAAWDKFLGSFEYTPGIGDTAEDMEFREMLKMRAAIARAKGEQP
jgi:hypothetical protein